jgi:XTP/dITP diphosphohydrolase
VEEDGASFLENAVKKARTVALHTGEMTLADDSGIEVDALQGAPGVLSARYAGPNATDGQNVAKLLEAMQGVPQEKRTAAFRCVLVLCMTDGNSAVFEGTWTGRISEAPCGDGGFGYDPIFFVPEAGRTAAQMTPEEKNSLSHRARALEQLKQYLRNQG